MNFVPIIIATVIVGAVGLVIGVILGVAGQLLEVKLDEKQVRIREALPGNNCGACGYPGCDGLAAAIFNGEAPHNACPVGGAASAAAIDAIFAEDGKADGAKENPDVQPAPKKRPKRKARCVRGEDCVGCGLCEKNCKFDAITVDKEAKLPVIDEEKCIGCSLCVKNCPKNVLEIITLEED